MLSIGIELLRRLDVRREMIVIEDCVRRVRGEAAPRFVDAVPVHLDPAVFAANFDPGAGNPEHHRKPYLRDAAANETSEFIAVRSADCHHRVRLDFLRFQDLQASLAGIVLEADRKTRWCRQLCSTRASTSHFSKSSLSGVFWSSEVMIAPKPIGHLCVGIVVLRTSARASGRIAPFISAMRQKPFGSPR